MAPPLAPRSARPRKTRRSSACSGWCWSDMVRFPIVFRWGLGLRGGPEGPFRAEEVHSGHRLILAVLIPSRTPFETDPKDPHIVLILATDRNPSRPRNW